MRNRRPMQFAEGATAVEQIAFAISQGVKRGALVIEIGSTTFLKSRNSAL